MIRRVLYFENSKPALIIAVKQIKKINADSMRSIRQFAKRLNDGVDTVAGAFAPAYAQVALAA